MYKAAIVALAIVGTLVGCEQVRKVEAVVDRACTEFRKIEALPAVQVGVAVLPLAAEIKSYGDAFCAFGAPATDTTSPTQQASWLSDVANKLLAAVRK